MIYFLAYLLPSLFLIAAVDRLLWISDGYWVWRCHAKRLAKRVWESVRLFELGQEG